MSKYTFKELEMCLGQECSLKYYGKEINGILTKVFLMDEQEYIHIKTFDNHTKEAFWSKRVFAIPTLDKIKDTKLWKLIA